MTAMTTRRRLALIGVTTATLIVTAACAAGPNEYAGGVAAAGFWSGLWHGLISPITFLVSLFSSDVSVYEVHNSGNWYDFGFVLGVAVIFSGPARLGGSRGARWRSRKSNRPE